MEWCTEARALNTSSLIQAQGLVGGEVEEGRERRDMRGIKEDKMKGKERGREERTGRKDV